MLCTGNLYPYLSLTKLPQINWWHTSFAAHENWPVHAEVFQPLLSGCISSSNLDKHGTDQHIGTVQRSLGVGFSGKSGPSSRPYYPTTELRSPSSVLVFAEPLSERLGKVSCKFVQMGSVYIWHVQMWSTPDDDPHCRLVPRIHSGWWSTTTEAPFCSADVYAITWMNSVATEALAKWTETN